jgi:hypothetical protein
MKTVWMQILEFVYTIAHQLGAWILRGVGALVPQAPLPADLVDPVGVMAVLTLAVVLAQVARKLMWMVVAVGWALIVIRIGLALFGVGGPLRV